MVRIVDTLCFISSTYIDISPEVSSKVN